jgi:N-acetyl-anhydromuramyl-L-alanine amidase AmpD
MDKRIVKRLAVLVPFIGLVFAMGCARRDLLVQHPPTPYFGPRVAVASATPRPMPAVPARQASWGDMDWNPSGPERPWQFIVIHHSATPTGSAAEFDVMHRAKGWDELGYHFVIGNGTGSGDGQVEVGGRWRKQKHGAHCKVAGHPEYNDVGIGICLAGNFDETYPSEAQMASLARLVRYLMDRYGVSRSHIYGHGQLKPTDCPGKYFNYADLFRRL